MKLPTDEEIRAEVYTNSFQETSEAIEMFINGALWLREKLLKQEADE